MLALDASALYLGMAGGSAIGGLVFSIWGAQPLPLVSAAGGALASFLLSRSAAAGSAGGRCPTQEADSGPAYSTALFICRRNGLAG